MTSWLAGAVTAALAVTMLGTGALPAQAADWDPASLRITKSVTVDGTEYDLPDVPEVQIGEEFQWNIAVICDQITDQCVNATLTDVIPAEFEIVEASINSSIQSDIQVSGQTVTIKFKEQLSLPAGQVGLSAGANVSIPVKLRSVDQSKNGQTFTNTAAVQADNAPKKTDDAAVKAVVPLVLKAKASKAFEPTSALANPGQPVKLTFGGSNTSNASVDRLVIQDPADPAANPNIFQQYLQVESLGATTWPQGATGAVVSVTTDGTTWTSAPSVAAQGSLALPAGVDPHDVRGIRIEFTAPNAAIPANASTSVQLALSQRSSAGSIAADTTLNNTSSAITGVGTESSPKATDSAQIVLRPASTSVSASKRFDPKEIAVVGQSTTSTVTLGATNSGTIPLSSLTINEPSDPADLSAGNLLAPAYSGGGVTFEGFGSVSWPEGAEAVSITYHFADGTTETRGGSTRDQIPAPSDPSRRVTGFSVTFTGSAIVEGAEATVPFTVKAPDHLNPGQRTVTGTNEITVTGETPGAGTPDPAPDTADDQLTIYAEQINLSTEKSLTRTELWSVPGQSTTAQLKTTIAPYPKTTTNPTEVIVDDPSSLNGTTPWYEHFDATGITLTQIPQNATLSIEYRDAAGAFHPIPGMTGISGASNGIFSAAIPSNLRDQIVGIRFIYRSDDGFVPGQVLRSNVTFTTRATERTTGDPIPSSNADPSDPTPIAELENCSAAQASAPGLDSDRVTVNPPCPQVTLKPVGPGDGPDIDKNWDPDLAFSHSRQNTTATLNWSVGGVQGLDRVVISDSASDPATGLPAQLGADSAFDTFNLTKIGPISDPGFAFDRVQVQLYNGSAWVDAASCTQAQPCSGTTIPVINLTPAEQASTQAVRFIVTEKPGRTPSSAGDPLPGTGVSTGNARKIPLTLQLRDTRRSNGDPVVEGPKYNTGTASQVRNTGSIEGYVGPDRKYRDTDSDTITIQDTELAVSTTKSWDGGPVAIPQDWGTQTPPTTRVTAGTTNQTAGGTVNGQPVPGLVSQLRLDEPGELAPADVKTPFEAFDLIRFHSLTAPVGTTGVRVEFSGTGAPAPVTGATAAAVLASLQALPVGQLRSVTGFSVIYTGSIASGKANGTGTVQFDLELRQTLRTAGTAVTAADSPVKNTVLGTVTDKRWDPATETFTDASLGDPAGAQVPLEAQNITVTTGKTFTPDSETEPNNNELTMTLTAKPDGSERTKSLTLTDDRATFWNAYDFRRIAGNLALPTFAPNAGPLQLQFSVCTGRDFAAWKAGGALATADCVATGGTWSAWTPKLSVAQAQNWAPADPSTVQGLRVLVTRSDDTQWENPKSPTINIPVVIKRRADLRSGGAVPSTLNDGGSAAPGEAVKGVTTNTVRADVTGVWGGTDSKSADASITYKHAKNAVQVVKDPIGTKNPGTPFDYTLTMKNTGDRDIVDPVITDRLPYDATLGTLVQFDPDAAAGTQRYVYALTGANPVQGAPMPTDPAAVTVAEDLDSAAGTPTIRFTFAPGTRLAPGQTYTITFKMMFVPGVVEGQPVVNGFDIRGDRLWDECTAPSGRTATAHDGNAECYTEAKVTPQRLPSIRSVKSVRAVGASPGTYNDHGFADAAACADRVDADGFAYQPCVPRTMPGQTEEWRLSVTNNGTTPLTRLVVADLLPTPGDRTLIAGFDRKSQWTPYLSGTVPTLTGYAGGTLKTYATTAPQGQICMTGVNSPTDANLNACLGTTAADAATKFVPFGALADHSATTALLFVVEPPAGQDIAPGQSLGLHFETTTGPFSQATGEANPKAFNSLTVSALYKDGATVRSLSARDQSNVGVALITGSVKIAKLITGDGAGFVPNGQVFSGMLKCTSLGVAIPDRPFTVVVGTATQIDNLPAGAQCTVTETAASGQTDYTVSAPVTVPDGSVVSPTGVPTLTITNTYDLTELVVKKKVQTDAAQIPSGFGFEVSCTFLGQPIALAPGDASFTLNDGGQHVISGLPVNAKCVVTETDTRNADSTSVEAESLNADDSPHGTVVEAGDTATITGLAPADGVNQAEFTNTYGAQAALRVEKKLVGGAADLAEDTSFTVKVVCTFAGETILDTTVALNRGNGWAQTLPSLVADAECTITEPGLRGADAVVITPNDGTDTTVGTVTIPDNANAAVQVEVTNRFLAGSLEVTKAVTGDGAALYGTGDFTVTLACTLNGDPVRVVGGADRTVSAANPNAQYTGLPSGAVCTLTESDAAGATASRMRVAGGSWAAAGAPGVTFTVNVDPSDASDADQAQTPVEVENRFDLAEVSITKKVESDAKDAAGAPIAYGPFEVRLECRFQGSPVAVTDAVRAIRDGETVTWENLPAGAQCTVTETDTADADRVRFVRSDGAETDGVALQLGALVALGTELADNDAQLVNAFDSTALTVAKVLDGDDAAAARDKTFTVDLVCTLTDASHPDGVEVWNGSVKLSSANRWRATVPAIASGAKCRADEVRTGNADATRMSVEGTSVRPASSNGTGIEFAADGATVTLTVTNTFRKPLPPTGALGLLGALGGLAVLTMIAGAVMLVTQRRRRNA